MSYMHFADRLTLAIKSKRTPVVVGLDPKVESLPPGYLEQHGTGTTGICAAYLAYGKSIVDVIAPLVPVIKLNSAFYELYGAEGVQAFYLTLEYAKSKGLITIADVKRCDIGSTAAVYAEAYLGNSSTCVDAITISPYLGSDSIEPFVNVAARTGNGVFVLVRTSNKSAVELQDLDVMFESVSEGCDVHSTRPLYSVVANMVSGLARAKLGGSGYSLIGAVTGATYPRQLAILRAVMPGVYFLVPGYGTQGGASSDVEGAFGEDGLGAIINNSRGIITAYLKHSYTGAAATSRWERDVEIAVLEMIGDLATNTKAGRLH